MALGINKDKTSTYQEHIGNGKYIVTIIGSKEIVEKAKEVMTPIGLHIDLQYH